MDDKRTKLEQRIHHITAQLDTSGSWIQTLEFATRLRGFSFPNAMLIMDQYQERQAKNLSLPWPSMMASRLEWAQAGLQVGGNQIGYMVMVPGGGVVCDVAQLAPGQQPPGWMSRASTGRWHHMVWLGSWSR